MRLFNRFNFNIRFISRNMHSNGSDLNLCKFCDCIFKVF